MGTIVMIFFGQLQSSSLCFFFKLVWLWYFQTVIIHITNTSNSKNLAGKQPNYFVWTFTNIKFLVKQTLVTINNIQLFQSEIVDISRGSILICLIQCHEVKYLHTILSLTLNNEDFLSWKLFSLILYQFISHMRDYVTFGTSFIV